MDGKSSRLATWSNVSPILASTTLSSPSHVLNRSWTTGPAGDAVSSKALLAFSENALVLADDDDVGASGSIEAQIFACSSVVVPYLPLQWAQIEDLSSCVSSVPGLWIASFDGLEVGLELVVELNEMWSRKAEASEGSRFEYMSRSGSRIAFAAYLYISDLPRVVRQMVAHQRGCEE